MGGDVTVGNEEDRSGSFKVMCPTSFLGPNLVVGDFSGDYCGDLTINYPTSLTSAVRIGYMTEKEKSVYNKHLKNRGEEEAQILAVNGNSLFDGELDADTVVTNSVKIGTKHSFGELESSISLSMGVSADIIKFTMPSGSNAVYAKLYFIATHTLTGPVVGSLVVVADILMTSNGFSTLLSQKVYNGGSEVTDENYFRIILPDVYVEGEVLVKFEFNGITELPSTVTEGKLIYEIIGDATVVDMVV